MTHRPSLIAVWSAYRMAVRNAWLRRSVLRRGKLLFEQEQTSGACLGAGEAENTEALPSKATETMNHTFRLVAATLCHAKLFGALAGQADSGNELQPVASGQGTVCVDAIRKLDALRIVTIAVDGTT